MLTKKQKPDLANFAQSQKPVPNVFLIVLDTVRADQLSMYGNKNARTKNLDAFAKDSELPISTSSSATSFPS